MTFNGVTNWDNNRKLLTPEALADYLEPIRKMTKRSWKHKLSLLKHLSMEKSCVFQDLGTYNLAYP